MAGTIECLLDPVRVEADDGRTARVLRMRLTGRDGDLVSGAVFEELHEVGRRLRRDRDVRAVVLTGPRPGVFAPHFRLGEIADGSEALGMPTPRPLAAASLAAVAALRRLPPVEPLLRRTPLDGLVTLLRTHEALGALGRLPQVVVAAIGGDAMGGGCELALACDVRVMADGPWRIGLPELSAGIPPGAGGSARLARVVGPGRALSLMLRSRVLTPWEALTAGLVDDVVPPDELLPAALSVARRAAARDPGAVASLKQTVNADPSLRRAVRREAAGFVAVASAEPARRRLRRFEQESADDGSRTPWRDGSWLAPPEASPEGRGAPAQE